MTKRDWLDVGIRLIGIWQISLGTEFLVSFANAWSGRYTSMTTTPGAYLLQGLGRLFVGLLFFLFAKHFVDAVYKPPSES